MRFKILIAFAAIYFVWGSTYLAIRYAVQTIPPFLMSGSRFLLFGLILYVWSRRHESTFVKFEYWKGGAIVGACLILGGVGGVSWAEQRVPSAITSLIASTAPLWIILLDWLRPGGKRPGLPVFIGIVVGMCGLLLLIGPQNIHAESDLDKIGTVILLLSAVSWAAGSLYSRYGPHPSSPIMATALQTITGSLMVLIVAAFTGEFTRFELEKVSRVSWIAYFYLMILGSLAYMAYIWVLNVSTPARAATHAYVNPIVAVFLGWLIAGEVITPRILLSAAVIVASVTLITLYNPDQVE